MFLGRILKKVVLYFSISLIIVYLSFPTTVFSAILTNEVPSEYIPIYQSAGEKYGVPWELLAAVHNEETSFSKGVKESSAGAVGHTQFMKCTWLGNGDKGCASASKDKLTDVNHIKKSGGFGVDANGDGKADPMDLEDAIYTTANYLSSSMGKGSEKERVKKALLAYNHSQSYVNRVMKHYERYKDGKYKAVEGFGGVEYTGNGGSVTDTNKDEESKDKERITDNSSKGLGLLQDRTVANSPNTGVKSGDAHLGADVGNWVTHNSNGLKDALFILAWIIGAIFLVYMSFCVLLYTLTLRGSSDGKLFQKITGLDSPYAKNTLWSLVKRMTIGVLLFAFFATGAFANVMTFIYAFLSRLTNL